MICMGCDGSGASLGALSPVLLTPHFHVPSTYQLI